MEEEEKENDHRRSNCSLQSREGLIAAVRFNCSRQGEKHLLTVVNRAMKEVLEAWDTRRGIVDARDTYRG